MARLFNVEVFNQVIGGGSPAPVYYSGPQFNALLGSADELTIQYIVDATGGSLPAVVTFEPQCNNTEEEALWEATASTKTVTITAQSDLPGSTIDRYSLSSAFAAYGRFKVTADKHSVSARIIVCGWGR
jgi:hypothetical protein